VRFNLTKVEMIRWQNTNSDFEKAMPMPFLKTIT